jgi:Ca-activated chloride channel family protein
MMKLLYKIESCQFRDDCKATKGGYVNGNNTKEVLAYVKSSLDNIKKPNLSRRKLPIFNHSFNGF